MEKEGDSLIVGRGRSWGERLWHDLKMEMRDVFVPTSIKSLATDLLTATTWGSACVAGRAEVEGGLRGFNVKKVPDNVGDLCRLANQDLVCVMNGMEVNEEQDFVDGLTDPRFSIEPFQVKGIGHVFLERGLDNQVLSDVARVREYIIKQVASQIGMEIGHVRASVESDGMLGGLESRVCDVLFQHAYRTTVVLSGRGVEEEKIRKWVGAFHTTKDVAEVGNGFFQFCREQSLVSNEVFFNPFFKVCIFSAVDDLLEAISRTAVAGTGLAPCLCVDLKIKNLANIIVWANKNYEYLKAEYDGDLVAMKKGFTLERIAFDSGSSKGEGKIFVLKGVENEGGNDEPA